MCVSVALVFQHSVRMRYYIVICGLSDSTILFHIISKTARFSGGIELKMSVLIFSAKFVWNFSHSTRKKNSARFYNICACVHVKYHLLVSDVKRTRIFSTDFSKKSYIKILIWIRQLVTELFHVDWRTERHNEASSRFSHIFELA